MATEQKSNSCQAFYETLKREGGTLCTALELLLRGRICNVQFRGPNTKNKVLGVKYVEESCGALILLVDQSDSNLRLTRDIRIRKAKKLYN